MGTPEFAVPSLRAAVAACDVVAVVTQPDRPRGRGRAVTASAVARDGASSSSVPVMKPEDVNAPESRAALAGLAADLFAVVAFGAILSPDTARAAAARLRSTCTARCCRTIAAPRRCSARCGTAAPAPGVTTLWMDEGIDTGDLILQRWVRDRGRGRRGHARRAPGRDGRAAAGREPDARARGPGAAPPAGPRGGLLRAQAGQGATAWSTGRSTPMTVWNRQRAVTPWPGAATAFHDRQLLLVRARAAPPDCRSAWRRARWSPSAATGVVVACAPRCAAPADGAAGGTRRHGRRRVGARRARRARRSRCAIEKEAHA